MSWADPKRNKRRTLVENEPHDAGRVQRRGVSMSSLILSSASACMWCGAMLELVACGWTHNLFLIIGRYCTIHQALTQTHVYEAVTIILYSCAYEHHKIGNMNPLLSELAYISDFGIRASFSILGIILTIPYEHTYIYVLEKIALFKYIFTRMVILEDPTL